jgi:hypothetical protein
LALTAVSSTKQSPCRFDAKRRSVSHGICTVVANLAFSACRPKAKKRTRPMLNKRAREDSGGKRPKERD